MQQSIRRQDSLTLQYMIQEAHKSYLGESRISKSSSGFNILRVLTALKKIMPSTPQHLYKLIMVITKKYNPQTLEQWKKGIEKINTLSTKPSPCSNISMSLIESNRKSSHSRILKLNEHSVKTYKEELDNEVDCLESRRSRLNYVGDFKVTEPSWFGHEDVNTTQEVYHENEDNKQNDMQCSNKNSLRNSHHVHYVSFQPRHKDSIKQPSEKPRTFSSQLQFNQTQKYPLQQKKINPYHEITRIDNLSLIQDRQPTSKDESKTLYSHNNHTESNSRRLIPSRSARDQSFVKGIDSREHSTTMIRNRSEMIYGSKLHDPAQYVDFNMTLEEWEGLNDRAVGFYEFNVKLKAFSALLANYQAFENDRFLKHKAKLFNQAYLESKVFIALKSNVLTSQDFKEKAKKADDFHNRNLCRKSWKILQVLKDLRIQSRRTNFQVEKMNRVNYEFFICLMFSQKQSYPNSPNKNFSFTQSPSFDLENKADYFSKTHNFQNVWNIYKYFGLNITTSKQQLTSFIKNYHQCLKANIFKLLKENVQQNKERFLKIHDNKLVEKSFSVLVGHWKICKKQRKLMNVAQYHESVRLKQKVFKTMLSIVYSTKIFSKRQQFIETKKIAKAKAMIFKKWLGQYKQIQAQKKSQAQKIQNLFDKVLKAIYKISFSSINRQSFQIENKIAACTKSYSNNLVKKYFNHLLCLLSKKKTYLRICQSGENQFQKRILSKWLYFVKVKKGINEMFQVCSKMIFRKLFVPLTKNVMKEYLICQEEEKNLLFECFQALKIYRMNKQEVRVKNSKLFKEFLTERWKREIIDGLKLNYMEQIKARQLEEINQKTQALQKYLKQQIPKSFFISLKSIRQQKRNMQQNQLSVTSQIRTNSFFILTKNIQQKKNLKNNSINLQTYLKSQNLNDFYVNARRIILETKHDTLNKTTNRRILLNFANLATQYKVKQNEKKEKSENHFIKVSQQKVLLCLAKNFIEINDKTNQLEEFLSQKRKEYCLRVFGEKTQKQNEVRKKQVKVARKQVFSALKLNSLFKSKVKQLSLTLRTYKVQEIIQKIALQAEQNLQDKRSQILTKRLQMKLFWLRFNSHFINSLFSKKHIFMAYKFRALKLCGLTFKGWKHATFNQNRQRKINRKSKEKQQNHRQKSILQMHKPTDCS